MDASSSDYSDLKIGVIYKGIKSDDGYKYVPLDDIEKQDIEKVTTKEVIIGQRRAVKTYDSEGKLHSVDGKPSISSYDVKTGILISESWHKHGKSHRDGDLPANIEYDKKYGTVSYEAWYQNDKRYREGNKPHFVSYRNFIRHQVFSESFDNQTHPEGLSCIGYNILGNIGSKNFIPKDDNPTCIEYDIKGNVVLKHWKNSEGEFHRPLINGPALIYYKDDLMIAYAYYLNGKRVEGKILE